MASEAITQNDLREILSRTTGSVPSEYRKLLWTNPSLSSGSAAFDLTFANEYDAYEIIFSMDNGGYAFLPSVLVVAGNSPCGADFTHTNGGRYNRSVTLNGATLSFTTGYYNGTANVNACVPYKIYGIKYERVAPPQIDALAWKLQGTVTGTTPITLPSLWEELCVMISGLGYTFTFNIPYLYVSGGSQKFLNGYANSGANSYWSCEIGVSTTSCYATAFSYSGGQGTITPTLTVYYR